MSNILVFGRGYIGSTIGAYFECPIMEEHITTYDDIQELIDTHKPKVVIGSFGHISKNIDDCEIDKTGTLRDLMLLPTLLAEAAARNNLKMVHISNGSIYNSSKDPISENEAPNFFDSFYSRAKIYTESILNSLSEITNILQVRIMHPLSYVPHPRNLLTRLLLYQKITAIPVSVTYMPDFLPALKHLIKMDAEGIYNVVNYGGLKYPELLEEYRKFDINYNYAVMDPTELKTIRTHPVLSTDKLEESGFPVRDIHDILHECCEQYWKHINKR